jgi:hypothetical protein
MPHYRPPIGGLFRLRGPQADPAQEAERRSEARETIRNFVRALERLDRDASLKPRPRRKEGR